MGWWSAAAAAPESRWVVLDVETTGLDTRRCELLAIAAVALHIDERGKAGIVLNDSFEIVLHRQSTEVDRDNILLHGIGVGAQRSGVAPAQALGAFVTWAAGAPLLGFHVAFDREVIDRHLSAHGLPKLPDRWLDIEAVAAVLRQDLRARSLDEWMAALGVHCAARHQAAADTLATAELLLKLWPQLARASPAAARGTFCAAQRLAQARRWLGR